MKKHFTLALFPGSRIPLPALAIGLLLLSACSIPLFKDHSRRFAFLKRPDGWTNTQIFICRQGDSDVVQLTTNPDLNCSTPAWSPDGSRIAFIAVNTSGLPPFDYELFIINGDRSGLRNLSQHPSRPDGGVSWSPDGGRLSWITETSGGQNHVMIINPDGSDLVDLTPSLDVYGESVSPKWFPPEWSPDGRMIAVCADIPAIPSADHELVVIEVNTKAFRRLTNNMVFDINPAWSPDGRRIVFQRNTGTYQLVSCNPDGSGEIIMTGNTGINQYPAWTSDGRKILFFSNYASVPAGKYTLRIVRRDGINEERELCELDAGTGGRMVISPDGRTTLCATGNSPFLIYSARTDGSGYDTLMTHTSIMSSPVWAPR